jgi:hypothetical protein
MGELFHMSIDRRYDNPIHGGHNIVQPTADDPLAEEQPGTKPEHYQP